MSSFRTELSIPPASFQLDLQHRVLTVGSCFAEVMGKQLSEHKFPVLINPFGTIFNPLSIHQLLLQAAENHSPSAQWIERSGQWFHYNFHSRFTANSQEALQQQLERTIAQTHHFILTTDVLLLTYGTAWVYTLKESGTVVANCHKVPAAHFERRLISPPEMVQSFEACYQTLKRLRPALQFIITVSPVRHTRDTLPLNQVSKSTLRLGCHELSQTLADVHYFPSYELMIDDLRDYRFYQADMIHPNEVAEDYIWQKFAEAYLSVEAKAFITEWTQVKKALTHRPFQADSAAHRQFLERTLRQLERLAQQADLGEEMAELRRQLE
jgi:hypothetical protein